MPVKSETEQVRDWLIVFPMYGIEITDDEHDLNAPMFGDCTVISSSRVPEFEIPITTYMPKPTGMSFKLQDRFPSAIVVRRKGRLSLDNFHNSLLVEDARLRAHKVSALLAIVFLAENTHPWTCGLAEQVHSGLNMGTRLDSSRGVCITGDASSVFGLTNTSIDSPNQLSRAGLRSMLFSGRFTALAEVLAYVRPGLDVSHVKTIIRTALTLADAIHSVTPSMQLLSAVTALEILLANRDEIYGSMERRLRALLGVTAVSKYNATGIFDARHDYVHAGDKPEVSLIPIRAIGLCISALARYAEAAKNFPHKQALLDYLDVIDKADRLQNIWSTDERRAFESTLRHNRAGHYYSWQQRTLSLDYPLHKTRAR